MKTWWAILALSLSLAGCAATDYWTKPGFDMATFQRDGAYCQMVAMGTPPTYTPQMPPSYSAHTTVTGDTAFTTIRPQPNRGQVFADLGSTLATAGDQQQAQRLCLMSLGYTIDQATTKAHCPRLVPKGACLDR